MTGLFRACFWLCIIIGQKSIQKTSKKLFFFFAFCIKIDEGVPKQN